MYEHFYTSKIAEADAKVKKTQAQAEAESNKKIASSITDKLIDNKIAYAREKHGWVTVKGTDTVVTKDK